MLLEQRQRIIKHSDKKYWIKFDRVINYETVKFKVWIDCNASTSKVIDINDVFNTISNLYPHDSDKLNNDSYHLIVDDIYERLATIYPDTSIWIEVTNNDFGLLAKYETRTPSTLLKI
jgi:ArsR family metal-binding transcriptional regulator